ncbi:MAG: TetR family transcriptional regulator [Alphaproteobacteria bacterium]|nr:TetR family transcriptional regulator [Alphaproteobacteria bacterium]
MNAGPAPLRDAHKALTRTRILDAAIEILTAEPIENLTFARLAEAAGVTERTVYRHFPSREELVTALWPRINQRAGGGVAFPETPGALLAQPKKAFSAFEPEETLLRSIIFSQYGQALRLSVNDRRQAAFLNTIKAARPDLPPKEQRELAALVQLLSSFFAWVSLKDYWTMPAPESGPVCAEAIGILLEHFGRKKKRNGAGRLAASAVPKKTPQPDKQQPRPLARRASGGKKRRNSDDDRPHLNARRRTEDGRAHSR